MLMVMAPFKCRKTENAHCSFEANVPIGAVMGNNIAGFEAQDPGVDVSPCYQIFTILMKIKCFGD
jgi:hypothetical protein